MSALTRVGTKGGTNLEFHSNRNIEYEYSVASNLIRILNGVDVLPGRSVIPWPRAQVLAGIVAIRIDRLLSDLTMKTTYIATTFIITYLICMFTHTRLQNKIAEDSFQ